MGGASKKLDEGRRADLSPGALPFLINVDGEEIVFAELTFRVKDEPALRKRLVSLRSLNTTKKTIPGSG